MLSVTSGVVSDGCTKAASAGDNSTSVNPLQSRSVRIDLNNEEHIAKFSSTSKDVLISSMNDQDLTKLNPFKVAKEIDELCGQVTKVQYLKSGSLFITTNSSQQTQQLLKQHTLKISKIPIRVTIAWNKQLSYGKIYAPEFQSDSLEYLLEILKPSKVVGIRNLFTDPNKAHIPLYVLTFLSDSCPEKLKVGYCHYTVDRYYPNPTRCGKCCRWGHSSKYCRSDIVCSRCSKKGHAQADCENEILKCCNCGGQHNSFSKECPIYMKERKICQLAVDTRVSFAEARNKINQDASQSSINANTHNARFSTQHTLPIDLSSSTSFPALAQTSQSCRISSQATRRRESGWSCDSPSMQQLSQESQWFTQQVSRKKRKAASDMQDEIPCSLDLPTLTQTQPLENSQRTSHVIRAAPTNQYEENSASAELSIKELLIKMLPILLKLFLAKQPTEKIACIVEIAEMLGAESTLSSLIAGLNHSSLSSSSQQ